MVGRCGQEPQTFYFVPFFILAAIFVEYCCCLSLVVGGEERGTFLLLLLLALVLWRFKRELLWGEETVTGVPVVIISQPGGESSDDHLQYCL